MDYANQYQRIIDDFVREKEKLHQSIKEFNQLQQEIDNLNKRASTDLHAQKKLQRVHQIMDSDFQQQRQCLIDKVSALQSNMENLRQMMQQETGITESIPTVKKANLSIAKKNIVRAFV